MNIQAKISELRNFTQNDLLHELENLTDSVKKENFLGFKTIDNVRNKLDTLYDIQKDVFEEYGKMFPKSSDIETLEAKSLSDIEQDISIFEQRIQVLEESEKTVKKFSSIKSKVEDDNVELKASLNDLMAIDSEKLTLEKYQDLVKPYMELYHAVTIEERLERFEYYLKHIENNTIFSTNLITSLVLQSNLYIVETVESTTETESNEVTPSSKVEVKTEPETETETEEFSHVLLDKGIKISERTEFGELKVITGDETPKKDKTIKKDCKEYMDFLMPFYTFQIFNMTAIADKINEDSAKNLTKKFDEVVDKGYARKIILGDFEPFYNTSQLGEHIFYKKNMVSWWNSTLRAMPGLNDKKRLFLARKHTQVSNFDTANEAIIVICKLNIALVIKKSKLDCNSFGFLDADYYSEVTTTQNSEFHLWHFGTFLREKESIIRYVENITNQITNFGYPIDVVILSSDDFEQCTIVYEYWKEVLHCLNDTHVFFYCVLQGSYYDYSLKSPCTEQDIIDFLDSYVTVTAPTDDKLSDLFEEALGSVLGMDEDVEDTTEETEAIPEEPVKTIEDIADEIENVIEEILKVAFEETFKDIKNTIDKFDIISRNDLEAIFQEHFEIIHKESLKVVLEKISKIIEDDAIKPENIPEETIANILQETLEVVIEKNIKTLEENIKTFIEERSKTIENKKKAIDENNELFEENNKLPEEPLETEDLEQQLELPLDMGFTITTASSVKEELPADSVETTTTAETLVENPVETEPSVEDIAPEVETYQYDVAISDEVLPRKSTIIDTIYTMVERDKVYCASTYLNSISKVDGNYQVMCQQLAYAMNDPVHRVSYTSAEVMQVFESGHDVEEEPMWKFLYLCTAIRTISHHEYDHIDSSYLQLYSQIKNFKNSTYLNDDIFKLLHTLKDFRKVNNKGIDVIANSTGNEADKVKKFQNEVAQLEERHFNSVKKETGSKCIHDTRVFLFSKGIGDCLDIVKKNAIDRVKEVKNFLVKNHFFNEGDVIKYDNLRDGSSEQYSDYCWKEASKIQKVKQPTVKLDIGYKNQNIKLIDDSLMLLCDWVCYVESLANADANHDYQQDKENILRLIDNAINACDSFQTDDRQIVCGNICLRKTLCELKDKLNGEYQNDGNQYYYVDFLKHGYILLDDSYTPELYSFGVTIKKFYPWERVVAHAYAKEITLDDRLKEIFSLSGDNINEDYGSAMLIQRYYQSLNIPWCDDDSLNIEQNSIQASKQFVDIYEEFKATLELSQSYGKVGIEQKEHILKTSKAIYSYAENSKNYGFFKRYIQCCEEYIDEEARKLEPDIIKNLNSLEVSDEAVKHLVDKAHKMVQIQNYTVTQDIINRIKNGDLDDAPNPKMGGDHLGKLIGQYDIIHQMCTTKKNSVKSLVKIIKQNTPKTDGDGDNDKNEQGSNRLIENFPKSTSAKTSTIKELLCTLGFEVDKVEKDNLKDTSILRYTATLKKPTDGYTHPIAPFGSQATTNKFKVLCLFGKFTSEELVEKFKKISNHTIVFLNDAMTLPERHSLARRMKLQKLDKVFIVVDRVVLGYLASTYDEETINSTLMEVTMPFSWYQPYSKDSSEDIPIEMFVGRKELLKDVESYEGANLVYGSQLGKTTVFKMARNNVDGNANGDRAVYVNVKGCDVGECAVKISKALVEAKVLKDGCVSSDWHSINANIKERLNSKEGSVPYLLLLIDDGDTLIESCYQSGNYEPIELLKDIQDSAEVGKFKFVISSLRDIIKFNGVNSEVFSQLKSTTIKPFRAVEARELLEVPLYYMGLMFPKGKEYLKSLILASTNYFPALIQFYCAKLLDTFQNGSYAGYDEVSTPPYEITETHLKKLLAGGSFNEQLKERFEITLRDSDNYYHIVALLMALCYYNTPNANGYSVEDVKSVGDILVPKINSLSVEQLSIIMDELEELNILSKDSGGYLFSTNKFRQVIGNENAIYNKLNEYCLE